MDARQREFKLSLSWLRNFALTYKELKAVLYPAKKELFQEFSMYYKELIRPILEKQKEINSELSKLKEGYLDMLMEVVREDNFQTTEANQKLVMDCAEDLRDTFAKEEKEMQEIAMAQYYKMLIYVKREIGFLVFIKVFKKKFDEN